MTVATDMLLPTGTFYGDDIPAGTFHGDDIPAGTFH
jgi:hypothetical protein